MIRPAVSGHICRLVEQALKALTGSNPVICTKPIDMGIISPPFLLLAARNRREVPYKIDTLVRCALSMPS